MNTTIPDHSKLGLKISEIMTRQVSAIEAEASVLEAAHVMKEHDVGMLPVLSEGEVSGLLTDRDIVIRAAAEGLDLSKTPVSAIMTEKVYFCYPTEDVVEAVETMEKKQIRRLLVLTPKKKLVGVLSIGDVAVDTGDKSLAGEVLKYVSAPQR